MGYFKINQSKGTILFQQQFFSIFVFNFYEQDNIKAKFITAYQRNVQNGITFIHFCYFERKESLVFSSQKTAKQFILSNHVARS